MWCDATDTAKGILLEVDGKLVEYTDWLRKKGDHVHIDVAELDALVEGLNLISRWGFRECILRTDFQIVFDWDSSKISVAKTAKVSILFRFVLKCRLQFILDMIVS